MRFAIKISVFCALILICGLSVAAVAAEGRGEANAPASPDAALAERLFAHAGPLSVARQDEGVPGWRVAAGGELLGYLGSTWEISHSVGYSGRPLDVLVAVTPDARIAGAALMRHEEPVLTLGISDADIAAYVDGFRGADLTASRADMLKSATDLPDVISRATVSTAVIRDGILRTARTLAIGRGLIAGGNIDRLGYEPADFEALVAMGALAHARMSLTEASRMLAGAKVPVPAGEGAFLDLYAGIVDPPTVGQNLLGQQMFTQAVGSLGPGESALAVLSAGLQSHRGTGWKRTGVFDRITIEQGGHSFHPTTEDYQFVRRLLAVGAPELKEISIFRMPGKDFDPTRPFVVRVTATRPAMVGGEVSASLAVDYRLPERFRIAPPEPAPLWLSAWQERRAEVAVVVAMLAVLTALLFFQQSFVRRPKLWRAGRLGYLGVTLFVLGWGMNGQLSVVQVVAFLHSLLSGFRWETFLVAPVIFVLWSFTALGLLFWGRGVYCGWLCPFGALQELLNAAGQKLGIRQVELPHALHERLWVIKYTLFVAILALSFYSMHDALVLAEAEPFKTAVSLRFMRAWPFLLFVAAVLGAGLFVERFYCRYLCPLGAALAIPAKLKIFDWLERRPQCGRECRFCETKCTVGAIDPLGRINPNECVLCLRCQVIYHDPATCVVLKRRARGAVPAGTA